MSRYDDLPDAPALGGSRYDDLPDAVVDTGDQVSRAATRKPEPLRQTTEPTLDPDQSMSAFGMSDVPTRNPAVIPSDAGEKSTFDHVRDTTGAALKIVPEAVRGLAQVGNWLTQDTVDLGAIKGMEKVQEWIDSNVASEGMKRQQKQFAALMANDQYDAADMAAYLLENPALIADKGITTIGSMLLPGAAAGKAGALVKASELAKGATAMEASVAAGNAATKASIITSGLQNGADTYDELKDRPAWERNAGAAVSLAASMLVGKVTEGGAEAEIAKRLLGDLKAAKPGAMVAVKEFLKSGAKEGLQEAGEELGNVGGEITGGHDAPSVQGLGKRLALSGGLGAVMGGAGHMVPSRAGPQNEQPAGPPVAEPGAAQPQQGDWPTAPPLPGDPAAPGQPLLTNNGAIPAGSPAATPGPTEQAQAADANAAAVYAARDAEQRRQSTLPGAQPPLLTYNGAINVAPDPAPPTEVAVNTPGEINAARVEAARAREEKRLGKAPEAHRIEINPADPAASIAAIAAAPLPTIVVPAAKVAHPNVKLAAEIARLNTKSKPGSPEFESQLEAYTQSLPQGARAIEYDGKVYPSKAGEVGHTEAMQRAKIAAGTAFDAANIRSGIVTPAGKFLDHGEHESGQHGLFRDEQGNVPRRAAEKFFRDPAHEVRQKAATMEEPGSYTKRVDEAKAVLKKADTPITGMSDAKIIDAAASVQEKAASTKREQAPAVNKPKVAEPTQESKPKVVQRQERVLAPKQTKESFGEMIASRKADTAQRESAVKSSFEKNDITVGEKDGRKIALTKGVGSEGKFRVTSLDEKGEPTGHRVYNSIEEASREFVGHKITEQQGKSALTAESIAYFIDDNGKVRKPKNKDRAFGSLVTAIKRGDPRAETSAAANNAQLLFKATPGEVKSTLEGHARSLTADEKKLFAAVMRDSYQSGMPSVALAGLGDIHVYKPSDDREDARHYIMGNGDTTMGFREELVRDALDGHAPSLAALKHYLNHETGHELDSAQAVSDSYASSQSPLFTIKSIEGGRKATGGVVSEVKNFYFGTKDAALKEFLGYPMAMWDLSHEEMGQPNEAFAVEVLQAETFAQLVSMWYNNRALLLKHLPQSHALMKELHESLERIKHDGSADRAVAEAVHRALRTGLVTDSVSAHGPRSRQQTVRRFGEREANARPLEDYGSRFDDLLTGRAARAPRLDILTPVSDRKDKALDRKVAKSHDSDALSYRENNEKPLGKTAEVDDVGHHFDKLIAKEFGGPLDYNNPAHVARAIALMRKEFAYQLKQARSGLDWYNEDIKGAFEMTASIIPELHSESHRQTFGITTALMSPGTKAHDNWNYGAIAYSEYQKTGRIPETKPEAYGGELWGVYGATTAKAVSQVNSMIEEMGRERATEWLLSHHTVQEINRMKHKYGNYKNAPVGGKMLDLQLGVYMFGEKVGPFALNVLGIDTEVTVDVWLTRTFNRMFGTMFHETGKQKGEMRESPTEPERRVIKTMIESVATAEGYSNSQVQAVLWFFEQGVYTQLGAASPSMSFSDGARNFIDANEKASNGSEDSAGGERATEAAPGAVEDTVVHEQATLADFTEGKVKSLLNKDGWAVLTGENPRNEPATAADNKRANRRLETDLKSMGLLDYQKVVGRYGGPDENSFVVTGITTEQADFLRDKYGQDAYLDRRGFVHDDDTVTPAKSIDETAKDATDFFTVMPNGLKWAADINFDGRSFPDADVVERTGESAPRAPRGMAARLPPNTPPGNPATWNSPEDSKIDNFIEAMQDKHVHTKRVIAKIVETVGNIADKIDVYLQEELFHGRAAKQTADFLDRELKPLIADMAARGVEVAEFETYLHNRHAEERNDQIAKVNPKYPDGGSGIDTADARAYLAGLPQDKRMKYEALARRVDTMLAATAALKVSGRLESQSTVDAWNAAYKSYVPLHREDMDDTSPGTGAGYSTKGKTKRATGSDKAVDNILGNIALDRERTITRAEKNRVSNALVALAGMNPNKDFWEVDRPPTITYISQSGLAVTTVDPTFKSHPNVVVARMLDANGQIVERAVIFNKKDDRAKRMAENIKNIDAEQLHGAVKFAAGLTRYFAAINTQYNPIFGVVNLTRDVGTGMFNLSTTEIKGQQGKVLRRTIPALVGIFNDLRAHRKGQPRQTTGYGAIFEEMADAGGQTGYRDMFMTGEDRGNAIKKELERAQGGGFRVFPEAFRWLGGLISDYNTAMENAVRVSAFRAAKESGLSDGRAASLAKNLTVNFNRKGNRTLNAGALYAFFNASVQGNARLIETLKGPQGAKILIGGVTFGVLQAMLLAAAGFDDDEPPEFVKERNIIIPVGGKKYLTIPMPQGLNLIANLGRIPAEFALSGFRKPGERVRNLTGLAMDSFNPMGGGNSWSQMLAPTILDPIIALGQNQDWTGKPIAREDLNLLAPTPGHMRAKEGATPFSKKVSEGINAASGGTDYKPGSYSPTPDEIDYLIGQFTGGVGREIGKVASSVAGAATGEEVPAHKVPLVGRFYGDADEQTGQSGKFYENLKEINGHEAEIKGRKGAKEDWQSYRDENPTAVLVEKANAVERDVSKLRKQKRTALADGAERDEIKAIEEKITTKMRDFNELVKDTR